MSTPAAPQPAQGPALNVPPRKSGLPSWLIPTLAIIVALGVGLLGGILIGQHTGAAAQASSRSGFAGRGFGAGGFGGESGSGTGGSGTATPGAGGFAGGGFTSGTIQSISGDKMVVKTVQGTTVTVTTDSSTKISKTSSASLSDLKVGERVTAVGKSTGSGSVTATTVTEGGVLGGAGGFGGFRGGAGGGSGTGSAN